MRPVSGPQAPRMELLAPAGTLEAVRAAVANGADSVYLGAQRFNARDEGAQLTMAEVAQACTLAHGRGVRIYLTLNILIKPGEMVEALQLLGEAIDVGVDAAIVQDIGLIRAIRAVWPSFEIHGSTQMTVHDPDGARLARSLGIERVVLARENTIEDIRTIRDAVPDIGLEAFVHGALCISYSGQCLMSGLISERSANRGSCAQACRKDYVLADSATGAELDRGFLISARDLAAHDQLAQLQEAGIACLKVEGRKKKPEYVATVIDGYRRWLDRLDTGEVAPPAFEEVQPLIQIYSRGFTAGMLAGRAGKSYITREQPDNRGIEVGTVVACDGHRLTLDLSTPIVEGDGLGFEPPAGRRGTPTGFSARGVSVREKTNDRVRLSVLCPVPVPAGWRVFRNAASALNASARASWSDLPIPTQEHRELVHVRLFGSAGGPLKAVWRWRDQDVVVRSTVMLSPARQQALDDARLREQLSRLGGTPFVLGQVDRSALADGLFLPVSALNHLRTDAVEELSQRLEWLQDAERGERGARIELATTVAPSDEQSRVREALRLSAVVFTADAARAAAAAGANEVIFDPFLRHPVPPLARVRDLAAELREEGVEIRLRTPTIVRPSERRLVDRWLEQGWPVLTGHAGMAVALAEAGRDVTADYAVNCFNALTAEWYRSRGVSRLVASVELTLEELGALTAPWRGHGFDVLVYGRPEGMTIEHCVLSAAYDRVPTTCRDLCVKQHPRVEVTDPAGYTFPVTTDSACRNRLLHSRPIEASEFFPALWRLGIRGYHLLFNMPDDAVAAVTAAWADALGRAAAGETVLPSGIRTRLEHRFTRGHFLQGV